MSNQLLFKCEFVPGFNDASPFNYEFILLTLPR